MLKAPLLLVLALSCTAQAAPPVVIEARLRGAATETIVSQLTLPLEKLLAELPGVGSVRSLSREGQCLVGLEPAPGADPAKLRGAAAERIAKATPDLLPDNPGLEILLSPGAAGDSIIVAVTSDLSLLEVSTVAETVIKPRLQLVPGVKSVRRLGEARPQLQISLDPKQLVAFDLSPEEVVKALTHAAPTEAIGETSGQVKDIVLTKRGGVPVRLTDVATLERAILQEDQSGVGWASPDEPRLTRAVLLELAVTKDDPRFRKALESALRSPDLPIEVKAHLLLQTNLSLVVRLPEGSRELVSEVSEIATTVCDMPGVRELCWLARGNEQELRMLIRAEPESESRLLTGLRSRWPGRSVQKGNGSLVKGWPGEGASVAVPLHGDDWEELQAAARELSERVSVIPGVVDVSIEPDLRLEPTLQIDVERERSAALGVNPEQLAQALRIARGKVEVPDPQSSSPAAIKFADGDSDLAFLEEARIRAADGKLVPLGAIATVTSRPERQSIYREGGRGCLVVTANLEGAKAAEAEAKVREVTSAFLKERGAPR